MVGPFRGGLAQGYDPIVEARALLARAPNRERLTPAVEDSAHRRAP